MSKPKPIMYFSRIGHKVFIKLENMVAEDKEFTDKLLVPIDELLREPNRKERDQYIRTLTKAKK